MPHMIVHHKVRNFAQWKPVYDVHEITRKARGSKSAQLFQNGEDSTGVFVLFEWDSLEKAKKFAMSDDLKKTMERGCVIGMPYVHFVKEISRSKA